MPTRPTGSSLKETDAIRVAVRVRPIQPWEANEGTTCTKLKVDAVQKVVKYVYPNLKKVNRAININFESECSLTADLCLLTN